MKKPLLLCLAAILSVCTFATRAADGDHAYTDGAVLSISYIRTQPGMFDEYLRYLDGSYKRMMDEYKKQGIILDYGVYSATPRSPSDPDLILTIKYKNMAALDDLEARLDPVTKQVWGTLSKADQAYADRSKMRTELGSELVRQLILK